MSTYPAFEARAVAQLRLEEAQTEFDILYAPGGTLAAAAAADFVAAAAGAEAKEEDEEEEPSAAITSLELEAVRAKQAACRECLAVLAEHDAAWAPLLEAMPATCSLTYPDLGTTAVAPRPQTSAPARPW